MKSLKHILLIACVLLVTSCNVADNRNNQGFITNIPFIKNDETDTHNKGDTVNSSGTGGSNIDKSIESEMVSITVWPPEKPEYTININNYDLANNKGKYLLKIKLIPLGDIHYYPITNYLIDVHELDNVKGFYEISVSNIVPKELQPNVSRISEDGQKVLLVYDNPPEAHDKIVEVYDVINKKVLYQFRTKGYIDDIASTPNFEYLLLPGGIRADIKNQTVIECLPDKRIATPRMLISPDGAKIATTETINLTKKLRIYDILSGEILDEINLHAEDAYLTQWHPSAKILYYTINGSFYYYLNTKEIVSIGQYFYEPVMSPDGRYVAYCLGDFAEPFFPLYYGRHWLYKECGYKEGLYIKDLAADKLIQVAPIYASKHGKYGMIPLQWIYVSNNFDNDANRYCFPVESTGEYAAISSCNNVSYVIDNNIETAWSDSIDYLIYDELEFDEYEGGIGEWIKIYKCRQVKIPEIDLTQFYFPTYYLEPIQLKGIKIINGYAKNKEIYKANNRVKTVEVILSDGTSYTFDLKDNTLDFQMLDFGEAKETRDVTIKILDIYEGSKYNDTCISEIQLIEVDK